MEIEELNNLIREYPVCYSYKPYGQKSQYVNVEIKKFGYNGKTLFAFFKVGRGKYRDEAVAFGSERYCVKKVYDDIMERKAEGRHILYADPL